MSNEDRNKQRLVLHKAYKIIFDSAEGQRVLADLEQRGFYNHNLFDTDPGRMAFNEGRRSLVLHIHHMADPNNFTGE